MTVTTIPSAPCAPLPQGTFLEYALPRVTKEDLDGVIEQEFYFTAADGIRGNYGPGSAEYLTCHEATGLMTFCVLVLKTGFTVVGEAACVSPAMFSDEYGRRLARERARAKLTEYLSFSLKEKLTEAGLI